MSAHSDRLPIRKTYKLYVGGRFPRSESGRSFRVEGRKGSFVANVARASRKDFRDAVRVARKAQSGWAGRIPFNRGQVLYRMAEMLESRKAGFAEELVEAGSYSRRQADAEIAEAIDRLVWYAGWADKYVQLFGSTNPVSSPHFDFTYPEPTGVVAILGPDNAPVLGPVSAIAPVIVSGNACVYLASERVPTPAIELGEVFNTSDLPGGVVNVLTGYRDELSSHVASHLDVDGIAVYGASDAERKAIGEKAADSVKRVSFFDDPKPAAWRGEDQQSPYRILPFVEFKTAWHPIGT